MMRITIFCLAFSLGLGDRPGFAEENGKKVDTILGRLARSMKPGTWAELKTVGHTRELLKVGNHHIYQYTHDACWDPKTRQFFFLGQGHYSDLKFTCFSDHTNSWTTLPTPWWQRDEKKGFGPIGHAYGNNALDPAGYFFHQQYGTYTVHRCDIARGSWDTLPEVPKNMGQGGHSSALEWFPELGGLVRLSGSILAVFDGKEQKWRLISNKKLPLGELHHFAEYNPVHQLMVFGGGNKSNALYKLDKTGQVTPLKAPPLASLDNTHRYLIRADSVTGDYLVVSNVDKKFFAFDPVRDSWRELPNDVPEYDGMVAAPVSTYGVILCCSYKSGKVWLYKHAGPGK